jgi:hypothetical protein
MKQTTYQGRGQSLLVQLTHTHDENKIDNLVQHKNVLIKVIPK